MLMLCSVVAFSCGSASVVERHVDESVLTTSTSLAAAAAAVAAGDCLDDGRRTVDRDAGPSGSRQPASTSTSLRRLLLEPVSDLPTTPASSSVLDTAAAVHVVQLPTPSLNTARPRGSPSAAAANGRRTACRSLPSAALRRILLNEDDSRRPRPQPPVTTTAQSAGSIDSVTVT